ncbi:MAG: 2-oxoglutarate oxidoreductase subunit KorB [Candidatus Heimdallarchaeota archaeon LC_2]|nr:MAG: 2-oxoglutarate oxidoreductase subunit KorB [Candidatus Heimdallarchaeota archaeon LC_2]
MVSIANRVNISKSFKGPVKPNWCPGCGDYGLLSATTKVLSEFDFKPSEVVMVSGIGCSSSFPHWTTAYGVHSLHGRALPMATGVKLANPKLKVIVVGGDGDGYGIGVGHFVHTVRKNVDLTYMVMNNQIYGLTLGQASPTSQTGHITMLTPEGVDVRPINPISLALGAGSTFVARVFAGDSKHMRKIIKIAMKHKGFAFIDVLSPCVTFNKLNTFDWFKERVYKLDEIDHDETNIGDAFAKSQEWGDKIPIGIFYQNQFPSLHDLDPVARDNIVVNEPLGFKAQDIDVESIFEELR